MMLGEAAVAAHMPLALAGDAVLAPGLAAFGAALPHVTLAVRARATGTVLAGGACMAGVVLVGAVEVGEEEAVDDRTTARYPGHRDEDQKSAGAFHGMVPWFRTPLRQCSLGIRKDVSDAPVAAVEKTLRLARWAVRGNQPV
jgi:hypothetical protein